MTTETDTSTAPTSFVDFESTGYDDILLDQARQSYSTGIGRGRELDIPLDDDRSETWAGLLSGIDSTQGLGFGAMAFLGDLFGSEWMQRVGMEGYQRNLDEAAENPAPVEFTDISSTGEFSDWFFYTLGNLVPTMATMMGTGGFGGQVAKYAIRKGVRNTMKAKLKEGLAKGLSAEAAEKAALDAAGKYAAKRIGYGMTAGTMFGSSGLGIGEVYGDTEDVGVSAIHGMAIGALDTVIGSKIVKSTAGRMFKDSSGPMVKKFLADSEKTFGKEWLKNIFGESSTEAMQGFLSQHARHWVDYQESLFGNLEDVDWDDIWNNWGAGAVGGIGFGGYAAHVQSRAKINPEEDDVADADPLNRARIKAERMGDDVTTLGEAPKPPSIESLEKRAKQIFDELKNPETSAKKKRELGAELYDLSMFLPDGPGSLAEFFEKNNGTLAGSPTFSPLTDPSNPAFAPNLAPNNNIPFDPSLSNAPPTINDGTQPNLPPGYAEAVQSGKNWMMSLMDGGDVGTAISAQSPEELLSMLDTELKQLQRKKIQAQGLLEALPDSPQRQRQLRNIQAQIDGLLELRDDAVNFIYDKKKLQAGKEETQTQLVNDLENRIEQRRQREPRERALEQQETEDFLRQQNLKSGRQPDAYTGQMTRPLPNRPVDLTEEAIDSLSLTDEKVASVKAQLDVLEAELEQGADPDSILDEIDALQQEKAEAQNNANAVKGYQSEISNLKGEMESQRRLLETLQKIEDTETSSALAEESDADLVTQGKRIVSLINKVEGTLIALVEQREHASEFNGELLGKQLELAQKIKAALVKLSENHVASIDLTDGLSVQARTEAHKQGQSARLDVIESQLRELPSGEDIIRQLGQPLNQIQQARYRKQIRQLLGRVAEVQNRAAESLPTPEEVTGQKTYSPDGSDLSSQPYEGEGVGEKPFAPVPARVDIPGGEASTLTPEERKNQHIKLTAIDKALAAIDKAVEAFPSFQNTPIVVSGNQRKTALTPVETPPKFRQGARHTDTFVDTKDTGVRYKVFGAKGQQQTIIREKDGQSATFALIPKKAENASGRGKEFLGWLKSGRLARLNEQTGEMEIVKDSGKTKKQKNKKADKKEPEKKVNQSSESTKPKEEISKEKQAEPEKKGTEAKDEKAEKGLSEKLIAKGKEVTIQTKKKIKKSTKKATYALVDLSGLKGLDKGRVFLPEDPEDQPTEVPSFISSTAATGAPIITSDGTVITGHTEISRLKNEDAGEWRENYAARTKEADEQGVVDFNSVADTEISYPVVVRIIDDSVDKNTLADIANWADEVARGETGAESAAKPEKKASKEKTPKKPEPKKETKPLTEPDSKEQKPAAKPGPEEKAEPKSVSSQKPRPKTTPKKPETSETDAAAVEESAPGSFDDVLKGADKLKSPALAKRNRSVHITGRRKGEKLDSMLGRLKAAGVAYKMFKGLSSGEIKSLLTEENKNLIKQIGGIVTKPSDGVTVEDVEAWVGKLDAVFEPERIEKSEKPADERIEKSESVESGLPPVIEALAKGDVLGANDLRKAAELLGVPGRQTKNQENSARMQGRLGKVYAFYKNLQQETEETLTKAYDKKALQKMARDHGIQGQTAKALINWRNRVEQNLKGDKPTPPEGGNGKGGKKTPAKKSAKTKPAEKKESKPADTPKAETAGDWRSKLHAEDQDKISKFEKLGGEIETSEDGGFSVEKPDGSSEYAEDTTELLSVVEEVLSREEYYRDLKEHNALVGFMKGARLPKGWVKHFDEKDKTETYVVLETNIKPVDEDRAGNNGETYEYGIFAVTTDDGVKFSVAHFEGTPLTGSGHHFVDSFKEAVDVMKAEASKENGEAVEEAVPEDDQGESTAVLNVPKTNQEITVAYKLVEASDLKASHDINGNVNKEYPAELQPRDRSRKSMVENVVQLAGKLKPALLGHNILTSEGAPIVNADKVVESGNGRVIAISHNYKAKPQKAAEYKEWLIENSHSFGFPDAQVAKMKEPVLVRERQTELSEKELKSYLKNSNDRNTATMSATEQAHSDAEALTDDLMTLYQPSESGDIGAFSNGDFLNKFVRAASVDPNDVKTKDGKHWSQDFIKRVRGAVFARAYRDDSILSMAVEQDNAGHQNIINALGAAAGDIAKLRAEFGDKETGSLGDLEFGEALTEAVTLVKQSREARQAVDEMIEQGDMVGGISDVAKEIALFIDKHTSKPKELRIGIQDLANSIGDELARRENESNDLLGEGVKQPLGVILQKNKMGRGLDNEGDLFSQNTSANSSGVAEEAAQYGREKSEESTETGVKEPEAKLAPSPDKSQGVLSQFADDSYVNLNLTNGKPFLPQEFLDATSLGAMEPAGRRAVTKYLDAEPNGQHILDQLNRPGLKGTKWAKQTLRELRVAAALDYYTSGRLPDFFSHIETNTSLKKQLAASGVDGLVRYQTDNSVLGQAEKPGKSVQGSHMRCEPTVLCASKCYTFSGNHIQPNSVRKSALNDWMASRQPKRMAQLIRDKLSNITQDTNQPGITDHLRLFDNGDMSEGWVDVINELNHPTVPGARPVWVQVFSKRPELLSQLDDRNWRAYSVDYSSIKSAEKNYPDLPQAYLFTGVEQDVSFFKAEAQKEKSNVRVVLLEKNSKQAAEAWDQLANETSKESFEKLENALCPFDAGHTKDESGNKFTCLTCQRSKSNGCFTPKSHLNDNVWAAKNAMAQEARNVGSASNVQHRQYNTARRAAESVAKVAANNTISSRTRRLQIVENARLFVQQKPAKFIKVSSSTVATKEDAAVVAHELLKGKVRENVLVIIAGENDKIIHVAMHSIGGPGSSTFNPLLIAGSIADTEGAQSYWLAHNHPSMSADPSPEDIGATLSVRNLMDGTGIAEKGHIIVRSGDSANVSLLEVSSRRPYSEVPVESTGKSATIAVTEPELIKDSRNPNITRIDNPYKGIVAIKRMESENGLLLLDNKHRPVGVVPLSIDEMTTLKQGQDGPSSRILSAIHTTNASAVMIKTTGYNLSAASNLGSMLSNGGVRSLDHVFQVGKFDSSTYGKEGDWASAALHDETHFSQGTHFYSLSEKGEQATGLSTKKATKVADRLTAKLGVGINVVESESELPAHLQKQIRHDGTHGRVKGMYDTKTGKAYLVAANLSGRRDAAQTVLHEVVGHHGLRKLLGSKMDMTLEQIYRSLSRREVADLEEALSGALEGKRGKQARRIIAEEHLAHLAGTDPTSNFVQRIVAMARRVLRAMFPGMNWSHADMVDLVTRSRFNLRKVNPAQFEAMPSLDEAPDFSDEKATAEWLDRRAEEAIGLYSTGSPQSYLEKIGLVAEKEHRLVSEAKQQGRGAKATLRPYLLGLMNARQIAESYSYLFDSLPDNPLQKIKAIQQKWTNTISTWNHKAQKHLNVWNTLSQEDSDQLSELAHDSTINGVDASQSDSAYSQSDLDDIENSIVEYKDVLKGSFNIGKANYKSKGSAVRALNAMTQQNKAHGTNSMYRVYAVYENDDNTAELLHWKVEPDEQRFKEAIKHLKNEKALIERSMDGQDSLHQRYLKLGKNPETRIKLQKLYRDVRDFYQEQWTAIDEALTKRMEDLAGPDGPTEATEAISSLRRQLSTIYFPLYRMGDFVVIGELANGEDFRAHYSSQQAMEKAIVDLEKDGVTIKTHGALREVNKRDVYMTNRMTRQLYDALNDDTQFPNLSQGDRMELLDSVNQIALRLLPDLSYSKNQIHRRNVAGYHKDAKVALAYYGLHGASRLARVKYGHKMEAQLDAMHKASNPRGEGVIPDRYKVLASQISTEMDKRYEAILNPKASPIASKIAGLNFLYYLGGSVGAGVVNLMQTAFVTLPMLGAQYGYARAGAYMLKALGDFIVHGKGRASLNEAAWSLGYLSYSDNPLTRGELAAIHQAIDDGTVETTQAHTLAQMSEIDVRENNLHQTLNTSKGWSTFMKGMGFFFHNAEIANRQISLLAAYRLDRDAKIAEAKKQGVTLTEDDVGKKSYKAAREVTYNSHFDYSAMNRARYLKGDAGVVLGIFKQYAFGMTYILARNAKRSILKAGDGLTTEEQKLARRTITGVLGMHFLGAGLLGLPVVEMALYALSMALGDDDEPYDAHAEFRNWLADITGDRWTGLALAKGPLSAMTGYDFHGRTKLGGMFLRDPDPEATPREFYRYMMDQIGGPSVAMGANVFNMLELGSQGRWDEGAKRGLPIFARNLFKGHDYYTERMVKNLSGDVIVDDISAAQAAVQTLGIAPTKVGEAWDANRTLKQKQKALERRRNLLLQKYFFARVANDNVEVRTILDEMKVFSRLNPDYKVNRVKAERSYRRRLKNDKTTIAGAYQTKKRYEQAQEDVRFYYN